MAKDEKQTTAPYNPLAKANLAESIVRAILTSPIRPLGDRQLLSGAGVYVIYYTGALSWYAPVAARNSRGKFEAPIYIGKAIPKGGRKGGIAENAAANSNALRERLGQHYQSILEVRNLDIKDFHFQSLVVDDIWIPLGENMLIEQFKPVWNRVIDGFGNKDPGRRRKTQYRSPWDVIHPGRAFAEKLARHPRSAEELVADLRTYFETGTVPRRLKNAAAMAQTESADTEDGTEPD